MTTDRDLDYVRRFPDKCCAEVSRKGECQACDRPAVAVVIDAEDGHWWPVCAYHTRRRKLVSLADLLNPPILPPYTKEHRLEWCADCGHSPARHMVDGCVQCDCLVFQSGGDDD